MRVFVIEAYGGDRTNGSLAHFRVVADSLHEAVDIVKQSTLGRRYTIFEQVDETGGFDVDEPGILDEGEGPYIGAL